MAFATTADIAARLGRDLSSAENDSVTYLLDGATAVIAEAADKSEDWADALTPIPKMLKVITVELVCRALANPNSLDSLQEQLGSASYSARFRNQGGGLLLTATEERLVRNAVYGTLTGTSTPRALHDRLIDHYEGRDIDEIEE